MSINREPGQAPNKLGIPMGDVADSVIPLFGLLAALHERNSTGRGRLVEIAMLDSLIAMQGYLSQIYLVTGQDPQPVGTQHPSIVPYGSQPTADGHVIVACLTERFWHNFARGLGREDLITDPRFDRYDARLDKSAALDPLIHAAMATDSTALWLDRLAAHGVPSAPILSIAAALDQDHAHERGLLETVHHPIAGEMRLVHGPIRFDGKGPAPARAPSLLGEDTADVLSERLDISEEEISALVELGVGRGRSTVPG